MTINKTLIDKHLAGEEFGNFSKDFLAAEGSVVSEILSAFRESFAMSNTEIWQEIAILDSQPQMSSELMLVIGISKLMRGEALGLLWLRASLSKFPTARNLHAYFIALCQLAENKEKMKLLLDTVTSFASVKYPDYLSYAHPDYITETYSVLPYKDRAFLITLENTFRNACMRDIFLNGYWSLEPDLEWVESILSDGDVLIDIGANAGIYTLSSSKVVGEKGLVYSFEPNPVCVNLVEKSIKLNNLNNIVLIPEAISNTEGTQELVLYAASDHNHIKFSDQSSVVSKSTVIGTAKIKVTTLDNYFANKKLSKLDIIKIDAEGYEKFVLQGGAEIIKQFKPKLILEINERLFLPNGYTTEDLLNVLECMDYSIFRLRQNKLVRLTEADFGNREKSFNIIAVSKK